MRQLKIQVPEQQYQFILELFRNLGFIKVEDASETFMLSPEQKSAVDDELKKIKDNPNYLVDWDDIKNQLNEG